MLTRIEATSLTAAEIVQSKPWACLRLRVFRIEVVIEDPDTRSIQAQSNAVFERLSKLIHLTDLSILGPYFYDCVYFQSLEMRLESGLAQLSSLKMVTKLCVIFSIQNSSAEEIAWMNLHWRRLDDVAGRLNKQGDRPRAFCR